MFAELTSWPSLLRAFREAARGKRRHSNVAAFEHRLEDNLAALRRELLAQIYLPGGYSSFYVREPKRRLISAAPFRDRVVHHALFNVIEPIFENGFISDSFANRRGKGTHRALDRCQELARRYRYVLQLDLRQFFPSIDHTVLRSLLARKLSDPGVLWLSDRILESGERVLDEAYDMVYFPGDDLFAINRPRGLPIGNLTSQFWANVLLDPIDHFVKRELRCPGYVRYVDDLLLFSHERRALWAAKEEVEARLERLRLTIHPGAHPKPVGEGIPFLGFVVWPEKRRLKRRNGVRCHRRLKALRKAVEAGRLPKDRLKRSVEGWLNHARFGNTVGLQKALRASAALECLRILQGDIMDLKLLADALVITLAPVLPYLIAGGTEAVKAAGEKVGEGAVEAGRKLWAKLRKPVEESPRALGAAEEVAEAPDDSDARAGLRRQLVKILEADPDLASELARLLDPTGQGTTYQATLHGSGAIAQGQGAVAAGAAGLAVGGNVSGDVSAGRKGDDRP